MIEALTQGRFVVPGQTLNSLLLLSWCFCPFWRLAGMVTINHNCMERQTRKCSLLSSIEIKI